MILPNNNTIDHAANGRLGAGAKTSEGLARSAKNASKHGLTSKTFCLAHNEDAELFATHREEFFDCFRPADAHEMQLVNQMIENAWLLCRARALSAAALRIEIEHQRDHHSASPYLTESDISYLAVEALEKRNNTYANLIRYAGAHERAYQRAARSLDLYRKNKTATAPPSGPYRCLDPQSFFRIPAPSPPPDETKPTPSENPSPVESNQAAEAAAKPAEQNASQTKPVETPLTSGQEHAPSSAKCLPASWPSPQSECPEECIQNPYGS